MMSSALLVKQGRELLAVIAHVAYEVIGVEDAALVRLEAVDRHPVGRRSRDLAEVLLVPRGSEAGQIAHRDLTVAARDDDLRPVETDSHFHDDVSDET